MARRPVFIVSNEKPYYQEKNIDFAFCPGFSISQKQKSITNLHESFNRQFPDKRVLEVSSKSSSELGRKLSAFSLEKTLQNGEKTTVEAAFQAGKIFSNGGPYLDLLKKDPHEVKSDERLRNSGHIVGFEFEKELFEIEPQTLFYNWIYINALCENRSLSDAVVNYSAFTDIEFNPQKSINCQAIAAAIYVSLYKNNMLEQALKSKSVFLDIVYSKERFAQKISLFDE